MQSFTLSSMEIKTEEYEQQLLCSGLVWQEATKQARHGSNSLNLCVFIVNAIYCCFFMTVNFIHSLNLAFQNLGNFLIEIFSGFQIVVSSFIIILLVLTWERGSLEVSVQCILAILFSVFSGQILSGQIVDADSIKNKSVQDVFFSKFSFF